MALPYFLTHEEKERPEDRLRAMLRDNEVRFVPELADCMGAKAAEMNGFEVIMISSGDLACAMTGIPDLQLLSVDDFCKKSSYTYYTPEALDAVCDDVAYFARAEGLEAHARSALARREKE